MKRKMWFCAVAAAITTFSMAESADERTIRQAFKTKLPSAQVISVERMRYADLYEVAVQGNEGYRVFYTDALGQIMLIGTLIETRADFQARHRALGLGARLARGLLLPLPRLQVRFRGKGLSKRAGAHQPRGTAAPLSERNSGTDR